MSLISPLLEPVIGPQSALFDRSHWGRIRLRGADRVRFLHNQSTHNIEQLAAGEGCYTVFVTSTGRTLDLASAYKCPESLLLLVSPGMSQRLYDWMDRYIFFSDQVGLADESEQTFLFTLVGANADRMMHQLGLSAAVGAPLFSHRTFSLDGSGQPDSGPCSVAVGSDLALPGYTFWGPKPQGEALWQALLAAGAKAASSQQWEILRVIQGRPMPQRELTEEDNPLEAGLWQAVSFDKGCYIGQETIARLNTYKGVKKRLWGLQLETFVPPGAALYGAEGKVGRLTSVVETPSGIFGLGYVRTKAGGEGLVLEVRGEKTRGLFDEPAAGPVEGPAAGRVDKSAEEPSNRAQVAEGLAADTATTQARVVPLPFVRHQYPDSSPANQ